MSRGSNVQHLYKPVSTDYRVLRGDLLFDIDHISPVGLRSTVWSVSRAA